jgi:hypothetical protein
MKIRWTGKTPVCNEWGSWSPGEIKELPDSAMLGLRNIALGFAVVEPKLELKTTPPPAVKNTRKRKMREELQDKFERDNYETRE